MRKAGLLFFIIGLLFVFADVAGNWNVLSAWVGGEERTFQVSTSGYSDPNTGFRSDGPTIFVYHTIPPRGTLVHSLRELPAGSVVSCTYYEDACYSTPNSPLHFLNRSVVTGMYLHLFLLISGLCLLCIHTLRRAFSKKVVSE